jgi:hypothetical protein
MASISFTAQLPNDTAGDCIEGMGIGGGMDRKLCAPGTLGATGA